MARLLQRVADYTTWWTGEFEPSDPLGPELKDKFTSRRFGVSYKVPGTAELVNLPTVTRDAFLSKYKGIPLVDPRSCVIAFRQTRPDSIKFGPSG